MRTNKNKSEPKQELLSKIVNTSDLRLNEG